MSHAVLRPVFFFVFFDNAPAHSHSNISGSMNSVIIAGSVLLPHIKYNFARVSDCLMLLASKDAKCKRFCGFCFVAPSHSREPIFRPSFVSAVYDPLGPASLGGSMRIINGRRANGLS